MKDILRNFPAAPEQSQKWNVVDMDYGAPILFFYSHVIKHMNPKTIAIGLFLNKHQSWIPNQAKWAIILGPPNVQASLCVGLHFL